MKCNEVRLLPPMHFANTYWLASRQVTHTPNYALPERTINGW